jgi:predicted nucleic acid-binding Zn ribbon protein
MIRLGDLLPDVVAKQPGASRLLEMRLQLAFRTILGDELAQHCEEVTVRGSSVLVTTANPAFAHQLRLDSEALLARLNEESGLPRRVRTLKVQTGRRAGR